MVRASDQPIRVLGAGHSFSPVATSEHQVLQLDRLRGLLSVDRERQQATVWAGTRLQDLGPLLAEQGLALQNQGDIDVQSLAGVISTATHGTGTTPRLHGHPGAGADPGDRHAATRLTLDRDRDGPRFLAAAVSLGTMGVISPRAAAAAPRLPPAPTCGARCRSTPAWPTSRATAARHRHFEFLWFPYSDLALTKTLDIVAER